MGKINSQADLKAAIIQLEIKQAEERKLLKEQYLRAYESLKPVNLIKSTFKEVSTSPEIKDEILNASVGLAAGYLSKMLFQGASHSALRKLFGTALMFGISNAVARHPEAVKSAGKGLVNLFVGIACSTSPRLNPQKQPIS